MINDVFLIAINCAGTPNKSYLHTMVNYKSSITFDYTINNEELAILGIGPITRIEPLPNGKVVTCPKLVVFYFKSIDLRFVRDVSTGVVSPNYDYLACIDNDNCMAGTKLSLSLTLFNPATTSRTTAPSQLSTTLRSICLQNSTGVLCRPL